MTLNVRSLLILLTAILFSGAGCVTTDSSSRDSRYKRDGAPERTSQESGAELQPAPVKPAEMKPVGVKPVEMKPALQPAQRTISWKTVRLGQTPVYATIPGNWKVKEDASFRFSLSARDEGNVIVRTVINEKSRISTNELLHEGILASRELPRPLVWIKPPVPQEPSKQGNTWYQEATYMHKNNTGRQVRGLHIMNPKGTMRAHAFMYSTNDDDLPVMKKVAESITFR
ncbi:MAG: hypothetical protein IH611_07335 [Deltaproteobacteria bacterium]|nr:hypothetical protein [Deltaproteobacteria bacterium]